MKDAKNRIMKKKQGITLIALVVTIVVLLILAGITISTLFGDNGIITAARKAAEETKKSEEDTEKGIENLINDMELATWTPTDPKYFTYTLDESTKTATITGVKEQYQVKAYYHNRELSKYDYVTAIKTESGEYITDVTIPTIIKEGEKTYTVKTIGNGAFGISTNDFAYEDSTYTIDKGFTSFKIPNTVTAIEDKAFLGCTKLKKIEIPSSVTSIGSNTFYQCRSLTNITIPNSVTSIGYAAFRYCTSLKNATIQNGVTSIGDYAFGDCTGLTNITIPDSITSIGNYAFEVCTSLTNITIPNSVTSIGRSAFYGCTGLTSITIPSSVTTMGQNVFYNIPSITVTVPFTSGNKPSGWNSDWNRTYSGRVTVQYQ